MIGRHVATDHGTGITTRDRGAPAYVVLVVVLALAAFFVRWSEFRNLEPRIDQAYQHRWVQDLRAADHLIPRLSPGESWRSALEGDEGSLLHHLLRRLYGQALMTLASVSLAAQYAWSLVAGDSFASFVGFNVAASCVALVAVGLLPFWMSRSRGRGDGVTSHDLACGLLALLAAGTSFHLGAFSPWGWHNVGIAATLASIAVTTRVLGALPAENERRSGYRLLVLFAVSTAAVYSFYTEFWYLPAATIACVLSHRRLPWRRRIVFSGSYGVLTGLAMLPAFVLLLVSSSRSTVAVTALRQTGIAAWAGGCAARAGDWFVTGTRLFSLPGLVLGLIGLVILASRKGVTLPLWCTLVHFLTWVALPIFALHDPPAFLRTYAHVIPLLCIGLGCALARLVFGTGGSLRSAPRGSPIPWRAIRATTASALGAWHLATQIPMSFDDARFCRKLPEFCSQYVAGQGTLRPMVSEIDRILGDRAVLLPWDDPLADLHATLTSSRSSPSRIMPPLGAMWDKAKTARLGEYLRRRRLSIEDGSDVYLLAPERESRDVLEAAIATVLGTDGLRWGSAAPLSRAGVWDTGTGDYGTVTLYRVDRLPPDPSRVLDPSGSSTRRSSAR